MNPKIIQAIAVTAELTGTELSEVAIRVMESDLAAYPETAVLRALDRCRKELKGRLTLAAALDRVAECDGRPGKEEAWSIALASNDESETVVWTEEVAQAMSVASPLLEARDKVAARMAFCETYERIVRASREANAPCRWVTSLGTDHERRALAVAAAVQSGRIGHAQAAHYLPNHEEANVVAGLLAGNDVKLLGVIPEDHRAAAERGIKALRAHLEEIDRMAAERAERHAEAGRRASEDFELKRAAAIRAIADCEAKKCGAESAEGR